MTPAYLRDKVLYDALQYHMMRLARSVKNGDTDLSAELEAAREMLRELDEERMRERELRV